MPQRILSLVWQIKQEIMTQGLPMSASIWSLISTTVIQKIFSLLEALVFKYGTTSAQLLYRLLNGVSIQLTSSNLIHHVSAILDIDFSPTGREFVTGSFDKTIRIFPINGGRSREVYHTKRMQQVNSVLYSMDNRLIISGSEDTNIRMWKSHAADSLK